MKKQIKILKDICVILGVVIAVLLILFAVRAWKTMVSKGAEQRHTEPLVFYTTEPLPTEEIQETVTQPTETIPPTTLPPETTVETTVPETLPEETTVPTTVPVETEPPKVTIDEVPLYLQTDYPDDRYGEGTIASSGCGIASVAMVATYLTDHEYLPDELADYFGGFANNNIDRVNYALEKLQLPYETGLNFHETIRELEKGKVAIALMNKNSILTDTQHFVVLSKINEKGRIVVLDPYGPNYEQWNLKNAFVEGFKSGDLSGGFGGSWVFDKAEMPEDPFIYVPEVYEGEKRYDFDLTEAEVEMFAKLLWMEVRGEPVEGQQAAAEVVLNRLAADNFPSTLERVIKAEGQFNSANRLYEAKPTQTQYDAIKRALNGPYILPMDVVFYSTGAVNSNVWGEIGNHIFCYQW